MELLLANYKLVLGIIVVLVVVGFGIYKFVTQPSSKQKEQIKALLLNLVIIAEREYSSKTGKIKFSYVYSELITKLPYLKYIPLSVIETLVEESLEEMRHLLETNPKIAQIINKEGEK